MFKSCEICKKGFSTPKECTEHVNSVHKNEYKYTCQTCSKGFHNKFTFSDHRSKGCTCTPSPFPYHLSKPQQPKDHRLRDKFRNKNCYFCLKSFTPLSVLENHLRKHTREKPFKCKFCWKSFLYSPTLRYHAKKHTQANHHGQGEVLQFQSSKCPFCLKKVLAQKLEEHVKIHSGDKTRSCYFCDKMFRSWLGLDIHTRIHTGEKPFRCGICETSFRNVFRYRRHMKPNSMERKLCRGPILGDYGHNGLQSLRNASLQNCASKTPQPCLFCVKTFTSWLGLEIHTRIHTGEKPFRCEICEMSFGNPYSYRNHTRLYHFEGKPTQFQYKSQSSLSNFRSLQKLPWSCYFCFKIFKNESVLEIHLRIHTQESPFRCPICWASFRYLSICRSHMKSHTKFSSFGGIGSELLRIGAKTRLKGRGLKKGASFNIENHLKIHSCYFCCKTFTRRYLLGDHLRFHTGERPFMCGICGKCYRESCGYQYHIKAHKGK